MRTLLAGFASTDEACAATSAIIGAGVVPSAIEIMDAIKAIEAIAAAVHCSSSTTTERRASVATLVSNALRSRQNRSTRPAGPDLGRKPGVCSGRPDRSGLHRPGRSHPAYCPARGATRDR
ncbi:FAD-linked oxidase C-terminal domain-containing protein [Modestobacter lapidis]